MSDDVEMREERQDQDTREAAREIARERAADVSERDRADETSLFAPDRGRQLRTRWSDVQARFVDDPREAVKSADALVDEVIRDLSKQFSEERSRLEGQWGQNDEVSTEDLRIALQRYRSFFERLLSV